MNPKHLIVASVILFGSLWGLSELGIGELSLTGGIPRAPILTAAGLLFLVLARRLWNTPGSSFALAAIASAFKFLQHPVWGCKIAAVLMVGAIFDIGFSAFQARQRRPAGAAPILSLRAALTLAPVVTFVSFVLFAYFARDVLHNPYWGMPAKMIDYQFVQGPIAAVLSIPAALVGYKAAERLLRDSAVWDAGRWLTYRVTAAVSGVSGVLLALALRY